MISTDLKLAAIRHYKNTEPKSLVKTCSIFNVKRSSLQRWLKMNATGQSLIRAPRRWKTYKITKSHIEFVKSQLDSDGFLTIRHLTKKLNEFFLTKISHVQIYRMMRRLGLTVKNVKKSHVPLLFYKNPRDIPAELRVFYAKVALHPLDDIICVGEIPLGLFIQKAKGWSVRGKRPYSQTSSNKVYLKFTGIFAMTTAGIIKHRIYEKGGSTELKLLRFFGQLLKNRQNQLIILDNSPSHRSLKLKFLINNKSKNNKLLYSVAYQPKTQAIGGFFAQLKLKMLGVESFSLTLLQNFIAKILENLPEQLYYNLIRGAYTKKKHKVKG
jgi:transposase